MSNVSIVGAYNTKFGNLVKRDRATKEIVDPGPSIYDLVVEAGRGALEDAGISADQIGTVVIGACSPSLFVNQEHLAPLGVMIDPALRFLPMTRVEGACASSSLATYQAAYAIEAGRADYALVVGVEKMNELDTKGVTHALSCSSYWPTEGKAGVTFPGLFAEFAKGYQAHFKISDEDFRRMLTTIAALGYKNGLENPLAHFGKGSVIEKLNLTTAEAIMGLEDRKNPMIAEPLRLHDCSLITDGAAALVLAKNDRAKSHDRAVEIAGIGHCEDIMEMSARENQRELIAGKRAIAKAFDEASVTIADVDIAEVHDCFTINQLLCTEALGLADDGRAGHDYIDGRFGRDDDKCAINLSGGLKSKGHPVGATGASMLTMLYKQLIGAPIGAAPSKQPQVGVSVNIGGSGVTNAVTVLKRSR
jgi:acetyl-CoA C-acetyltransferase